MLLVRASGARSGSSSARLRMSTSESSTSKSSVEQPDVVTQSQESSLSVEIFAAYGPSGRTPLRYRPPVGLVSVARCSLLHVYICYSDAVRTHAHRRTYRQFGHFVKDRRSSQASLSSSASTASQAQSFIVIKRRATYPAGRSSQPQPGGSASRHSHRDSRRTDSSITVLSTHTSVRTAPVHHRCHTEVAALFTLVKQRFGHVEPDFERRPILGINNSGGRGRITWLPKPTVTCGRYR